MKAVVPMLVAILIISGCATTTPLRRMDGSAQYAETYSAGLEYNATVELKFESGTSVHDALFVKIDGDSVRWLEPPSAILWRSAAIDNVHAIIFRKHDLGALEGCLIGATPGVVLLIVGAVSGGLPSEKTFGSNAPLLAAAPSLLGAFVGVVVGGIIGHSTRYVATPP